MPRSADANVTRTYTRVRVSNAQMFAKADKPALLTQPRGVNCEDPATLLRVWMAQHRVTSKVLAAQLNCDRASLTQWRLGRAKPRPVYRATLEQITAGEVPARAWGDE